MKHMSKISAYLIALLAVFFGIKALKKKKSGYSTVQTVGETLQEAAQSALGAEEEARRKIMAEMGRKGGQKSKRGKAKPKPQKEEERVNDQQTEVPA